MNCEDKYYEEYDKLIEIANQIRPYYDIDKIKSWSVYIWTKGDNSFNAFDIGIHEIIFFHEYNNDSDKGRLYTDDDIIEESKPIIKKNTKAT